MNSGFAVAERTEKVHQRIDILFVSELPLWPRDLGYRVHGLAIARALVQRGVSVGLATMQPTTGRLPVWLANRLVDWPRAEPIDLHRTVEAWRNSGTGTNWLRQRIASHQGVSIHALAGLATLVRRHQVKAVVALGQHGPMLLWGLREAVPDVKRIAYAADDPLLHQLSLWRTLRSRGAGGWLRQLAVAGALDGLFMSGADGAIAVSETDRQWLASAGRVRRAVCIPNGVDLGHFRPDEETQAEPFTAVFWGRLDFAPNADAVRWFVRRIWPGVLREFPGAAFHVIGKGGDRMMRALGAVRGVNHVGEVADVRPWAAQASAVVLPMRCGHGIKNKLLEAAAMGRPILVSPRAAEGLRWDVQRPPFIVCHSRNAWQGALTRIWTEPDEASQLAWRARWWVERHHRWDTAAGQLLELLHDLLEPDRCIVENILHRQAA